MAQFGERLRYVRELRGMTQESLAELADVDTTTVYRWESGNRAPQQDKLIDLADALDVSTDFLLGRTDDLTPPLASGVLDPRESAVIAAMRRGDTIGALRQLLAE